MSTANTYKGFEHGIDIIKPPYKALIFQALKNYQQQINFCQTITNSEENKFFETLLKECTEVMNYIDDSTETTDVRKHF